MSLLIQIRVGSVGLWKWTRRQYTH